jgi:predicted RNase H-like HicB family nuclease
MKTIFFDTVLLRERGVYVAWTPQLDVSSCGDTAEKARDNLKTAARLLLEEAQRKGTLAGILEEAGYTDIESDSARSQIVATETMAVSVGA